jgi:hypothetical protein
LGVALTDSLWWPALDWRRTGISISRTTNLENFTPHA